MVLPPANTISEYNVFLKSISVFLIEVTTRSAIAININYK